MDPPKGGRADRPLGLDAGKVSLPDDWDSPETNRRVARMFGVE